MAYKNPALKILEVGAGTGATTRRVLDRLTCYTGDRDDESIDIPRLQSYTFTDISPGFFEEAKHRLVAYASHMKYAVLNLDKSPFEQGFEGAQYDVVLASLVLHATTNLARTLQRLRALLKPNGKLIMLEATAPMKARMSFFFGLLPGWRVSEEPEREFCPLLTEATWHKVLQETGFSGLDVRLPDLDAASLQSFTVFVSTVVEDETQVGKDPPSIIIIASEDSASQKSLSQKLQNALTGASTDVQVLTPKRTVAVDLHYYQCISLLEMSTSFFENIEDEDWNWFKTMLNTAQGVLWVTCECTVSVSTPTRALVKGLGRAIRSENVDAHFIDLALAQAVTEDNNVGHIIRVYQNSLRPREGELETEYIEHNGEVCIGRVAEATALNWQLHFGVRVRVVYGSQVGRILRLNIQTPRLLDTLCFDDDNEKGGLLDETLLGPEDVEIQVRAVGGSFFDALVVTGEASSSFLGHECSGIVLRAGPETGYHIGSEVAACTRSGAYKNVLRTHSSAVMRVPKNMSLVTAATIPSVFATAYYALVILANIQQGESVLIHWGASDVGQAAIQIACRRGARVFTTVDINQSKSFLRDTYKIPEENILLDQDPDLSVKILAMTGTGVDAVLSSPEVQNRQVPWAYLAPLGRFIERAANLMTNSSSANRLPPSALAKGVSIRSVCLDLVMQESKPLMRRIMNEVFQLFTGDDTMVTPAPLRLFCLSQIESAFRCMLEEINHSKIVVEMRPEDQISVLPTSLSSYYFEGQATYVIAGGLGGLGQDMVRWMVRRRAHYFMLLSRSGAEGSEAARGLIQEMAARNIQIFAPRCDITDDARVKATFEECARMMPPIKGCIQGAMVLSVRLLDSTTAADIKAVLAPKTTGTLNLIRHLSPNLDFLVLLSSISGATGSRGQANYAMVNTFQDAIARQLAGRPCLSLNLGSILSAGFAAEHALTESLRRDGFVGLSLATFLSLLDWACHPANRIARDPTTAQIVSGLAGAQCLDTKHFRSVYWASKPMFRPLLQLSGTVAAAAAPPDTKALSENNFAIDMSAATTADDAVEVALAALADRLARLLAVPAQDIDSKRPITAYGIDSLIALELRQWAKWNLKADTAILDIMQSASIEALAKIVASRSELRKKI